jgi:hypothetical protein
VSGNVVDTNFTLAMDNAAREAANMQSQSGDGQSVSLCVLTFWIPPKRERLLTNTNTLTCKKIKFLFFVILSLSLLFNSFSLL